MPGVAAKTARAAALPPEERRRTIVAATTPLLLEHGAGVTTRQIAEAAGVAEGTLFRAFPDKDAIIAAVIEATLDTETFDAELRAIDSSLPLRDRLVRATEIVQERIMAVWQVLSAIGPAHAERRDGPLDDSAALIQVVSPDADAVRVDPVEAARRLRALTLALTHPILVPTPTPPEDIVDMFLHGLAS